MADSTARSVADVDMVPATPQDSRITVIVDSLPGQNISFATPKNAPLSSIYETLHERAPWIRNSTYILTTNARRLVTHDPEKPISSLLTTPTSEFLSLRLTVPLCGGKGGFGSILRAQGGRMSSRKKQGDQNASSRNLDGRRLRTVAEAKALAEYLAIKPEMEKKERDEKRKRWEDIVATTERKQDEILTGKAHARLDGKWVDSKEEAETKTREAIEKMLQAQLDSSEDDEETSEGSGSSSKAAPARAMFGWENEDDEFMSDSEEEDEEEEDVSEEEEVAYVGKGKGKA